MKSKILDKPKSKRHNASSNGRCPLTAAFCAFVERNRVNRQLTYVEYANLTGVSASYLQQIAFNVFNPSLAVCEKICRALGFKLGDVLNQLHREIKGENTANF